MAKKVHKCPRCELTFTSNKKRRDHQAKEHGNLARGRQPANGFALMGAELTARKAHWMQAKRLGQKPQDVAEWSKQWRAKHVDVGLVEL